MLFRILLAVAVSLLSSSRHQHGVSANGFPIKKFFGWEGQDLPANVELKNLLCHASLVGPVYLPIHDNYDYGKVCACDVQCMKFRTCCVDYLWNTTTHIDETVSDYTKRFVSESGQYPKLECNPIAAALPETFRAEQILMRSDCTDTATEPEKVSCRANKIPSDIQPVLGTDDIVYKNKHCAMCNSVGEFKRLRLKAKDCLPTNQPNATSFTDRFSGCFIALESLSEEEETSSIRSCSLATNIVKPPKPTSDARFDFKLCQSYKAGFNVGMNYECYDNPNCYSVIKNSKLTVEDVMGTCQLNLPKTRLPTPSIIFDKTGSYSVLVSFEDLHKKDGPCPPGQIYDTRIGTCVEEFVCGFGYQRSGDSCIKQTPPDRDLTNSAGSLNQRKILEKCLSTTISAIVTLDKKSFGDDITTNDVIIKVLRNTSTSVVFTFNRQHLLNITRSFSNQKIKIIESTTGQHYLSTFYGVDFQRTFHQGRICAKLRTSQKELRYNLSSNCWLMTDTQNIPNTQYVLNRITGPVASSIFIEIATCERFHLDSPCAKRVVTNFTKYDNGTVFDEEFKIVLSTEEYIPLDGDNSGSLGTCLQTSGGPTTKAIKGWEKVTSGVEKYITIVGCMASVLGYLWMIFTYTIIPALKTIPGQNIVCLCTMLLCSDVIMLVTMLELSFPLCAAFGMLLHFFSLSAQVWAGLLAYDIWSTFHGRGQMRKASSTNRFRIYLSIGYVIPLLFVLVCVVMEVKDVVVFGYGVNGVCWIAFFTPRLFVYILPMVCITLFNVAVLSYTIFSICKQSRKSKKLLKKTGGQDVSLARMALKLVVLLGAIELLGLVQIKGATTDQSKILNSVFRIVYSIARSFRGVFIWLLYIVTDQVFRVYRDIRSQGSLRTRSSFASSSMSRGAASSTRRRSEMNRHVSTAVVSNGSGGKSEETHNLMGSQPTPV